MILPPPPSIPTSLPPDSSTWSTIVAIAVGIAIVIWVFIKGWKNE